MHKKHGATSIQSIPFANQQLHFLSLEPTLLKLWTQLLPQQVAQTAEIELCSIAEVPLEDSLLSLSTQSPSRTTIEPTLTSVEAFQFAKLLDTYHDPGKYSTQYLHPPPNFQ